MKTLEYIGLMYKIYCDHRFAIMPWIVSDEPVIEGQPPACQAPGN